MFNEIEHAKGISSAVEVRRSPNYREFYCNATKMRVSPWDVVLTLLMQVQSGPGTDAIAQEEQASMTMSPQHFKAFAEAIALTLQAYEAAFGKVTVAPQFMPKSPNPEDIEKAMRDAS